MKLYAQGLARRLHAQRVGHLAEADGGPPEPPRRPRLTGDSPKAIKSDHANGARGASGANGSSGSNDTNGDGLRPRDGANGKHVSSSRVEPASLSNHDGEAVLAESTFDPRVAHQVKPLSQAQLNAIDLLVLGHSDRSAANHLGVHYTSIGKWRQYHPAFRAELARRRQEVWGGACERFRQLLERGVAEIEKQLGDEDKVVRFRAARAVLALARHFRPPDEPADVEGVLTLEARRLNVAKHELHPAQSLVYEVDREEALQHLMNRAREDFTVAKDALPHAAKSMKEGLLSSGV